MTVLEDFDLVHVMRRGHEDQRMRLAFRTLSLTVPLASLMLSLTACKADPAVQKGQLIDRGTKTETQPAPVPAWSPQDATPPEPPVTQRSLGQVTGVVSFAGKPPARIPIDTTMDPACSSGHVLTEQYVINAGKLANVFLYIKAGPAVTMHLPAASSAPPVMMDQRGCQYVPHVIGVAAGGYVEFRNSDATMHNVHTMPAAGSNETVDISMGPHGTPIVKQFLKPELMIPVRCNNHPWMQAFINVSPTPFFTVSDATGHFTVRGLPPGTYTLAAVHEKLGERDINVTVKPNAATNAEVVFAAR